MHIKDSATLKEILDSMSCFVSLEDELIKLFCLVSCAPTDSEHRDYFHKEYLKEKIGRIMSGNPLTIDNSAKAMYIGIKLGQVNKKSPPPL